MNDDKPESSSEIAEGLPPIPPVDGDRAEWVEHDVRAKEPTAIEVFYAWEKIRILYNVIVTLFVFGSCIAIQRLHHFEATHLPWLYLAANIFFCIGPVIENYLSCVGLPRKEFRWVFMFMVVLLGGFLTYWIASEGGPARQ